MKSILIVSACIVLLAATPSRGENKDDDLALCKEITNAKASLSDGIRQVAFSVSKL